MVSSKAVGRICDGKQVGQYCVALWPQLKKVLVEAWEEKLESELGGKSAQGSSSDSLGRAVGLGCKRNVIYIRWEEN